MRGRGAARGVVALMLALASVSRAGAAGGYAWQLPPGFPEPAVPADNPMSAAKVALGRRLFFETGLSVNGSTSCARCHDPTRAFTDGRARARGALGDALPRGTMSLANVAWNASYGWNDRAVRSLETQMRQPLFNTHPVEMGLAGREAEVITFLSADAEYGQAFERAFPEDPAPIRIDNLIRAIASFERTLVSGGSPFDHYVYRGEHEALDAGEKRGLALFYSRRLGCANCHGGFNFSGTWTERDRPHARPAFARDAVHGPLLRVPTLRNVALTAPYMHDGRYASLEEVIAHYEREGRRQAQSTAVRSRPSLQTFELSAAERRDLIAFLGALTDRAFVNPQ